MTKEPQQPTAIERNTTLAMRLHKSMLNKPARSSSTLGFVPHPNLRRSGPDGTGCGVGGRMAMKADQLERPKLMRYRRALIPGASYFFTVNLADRSARLLVERIADLREVVRDVRRAHPFEIVAWVVLPDHLHAVWTLPDGDADYATRWGLIKAGFSRRIPKGERIRASRARKGERGIWQRRFWEHLIRDDRDLAATCRLHPLQPRQAWLCRSRDRLAVFDLSPRPAAWECDGGLGVRDDDVGDFGEASRVPAGHVGVRSSPQPTMLEFQKGSKGTRCAFGNLYEI